MTKQGLLAHARRLMKQRIMFEPTKIGDFEITRKPVAAGSHLTVASMRDALFSGIPNAELLIREDTFIHSLIGPEGTWMSDVPAELVQMHLELARHATGRILIGGLGLGILARMVAVKERARKIVVVERQSEVISLVRPYLCDKVTVIEADINDYVEQMSQRLFDCALLDTWQGTGEWTWQSEVIPLRRAIGDKIPWRRVYCWHEDVMRGQVSMGLFKAASVDPEILYGPADCHKYAFSKAAEEAGIKLAKIKDYRDIQALLEAESINGNNERLRALAVLFLHTAGSEGWEQQFGKHWDAAWSAREEAVAQ